jgi:hypothetical protein
MSAQTYCPTCGYPNDTARGACLLCYTNVRPLRAGNACPSCGGENPKGGSFCMSCQTALVEGVVAQKLPDISGLVGAAAAGGAAALSDEYVGEPAGEMDFGVPEPAHAGVDSASDFAEDFAAPPPPPAPDTGSQGFMVPPAAPSESTVDMEEDFSAPPPPPPDTVDLDLDTGDAAPPPPAPDTGEVTADTGTGDELSDWSLDYDQ